MRMLRHLFLICAFLFVPSWLAAQLTPFGTANVPTEPWNVQGLGIPPNSTSASVQFTADPSAYLVSQMGSELWKNSRKDADAASR